MPFLFSLDCEYCPQLTELPLLPHLNTLSCAGCTKLVSIPDFPNLDYLHLGTRIFYKRSRIGRMLMRVKKTLRQRWARKAARDYLKTEAYRQLVIGCYERDRAKLVNWLSNWSEKS